MKKRKEKDNSSYGGHKLLLSKDWFEVVRVDCGIASILFLRINVLPSSENVQFDAKMTKTEPDDKIELRKVFRPPYLSLCQYLSSRKILKIFIIYNNVDRISQTF